MVGRLLRTADFERVLAKAPCSRSAHFAAHHVAAAPLLPAKATVQTTSTDLSTDGAPIGALPVDDLGGGHWLGTVVPKRHARRSVTRNLLKRQMRTVMDEQAALLPPGLWVLRLKAPFDPRQFGSAASTSLKHAAHEELQTMLQRAARAAPRPTAG
ncbi:MAG: ribonuclease P protein component [Burkholderiales bacterium]|nr:ribonuclease P protein component [Burkholderiales bacterium]